MWDFNINLFQQIKYWWLWPEKCLFHRELLWRGPERQKEYYNNYYEFYFLYSIKNIGSIPLSEIENYILSRDKWVVNKIIVKNTRSKGGLLFFLKKHINWKFCKIWTFGNVNIDVSLPDSQWCLAVWLLFKVCWEYNVKGYVFACD